MNTPAPHDNLPDPPPVRGFEQSFFRPPIKPTGGTVYIAPVTYVTWFRRAPTGGGTVRQRPADTTGETP